MSANSRTRPRSRRTKAKQVRYNYDSDTEEDGNGSAQARRPSRRSQRIQSYLEETEDEPDCDLESLHSSDPSQTTVRRVTKYQPPPTRSKTNKRKRGQAPKKTLKQSYQLFKRRKPNSHVTPIQKRFTIELPPSGRVPPWQELPYHVLQQVMKYASYPLYEKASRTTSSIEWLCGVSSLCKSFHEACAAALLYSPPLYPSFRAHGLLQLLAKHQTNTLINYRNKIKCLDIEVKNLLIRKSGINITDLLGRTPLLEKLRLYHNHDDLGTLVWAQPSQAKGRRYAYPDELFQKLDDMSIRLKSWEWNGRFPSGKDVLQQLASVHTRASFSELQELSFLNITLPEKASEEEISLSNSLLVSALQHLPDLKSLSFHNSNILNAATLAQLPPNLTSLAITNCQTLTSDLLSIYLSSHGSSLTVLTLSGNQSMSLAFLSNLNTLCPSLQRLDLDLTYTDPSSYRDRDPLYDEALPNGPPSWPSSLVSIEIENLRQLNSSEAEEFLNSLVSTAPELQSLRKIVIKAIVKAASWRDRAELRNKWIGRLEDVFLDRSQPETRVHVTQARPKPKIQEVARRKLPELTPVPPEDSPKKEETKGRQSSRIAHLKQVSLSSQNSDSNESYSDTNPSSVLPATPSQIGSAVGSANITGPLAPFKQGKCSIVTLILSDQRPAQDQFHENDFLDSERSGDEEWRGHDLDFD